MSHDALGFSESQWEVLKHGPLYMLAQVGGADSYIDSAEWTALLDLVSASAASDDQLIATLMSELGEQLHHGKTQIPNHHSPLEGLFEIGRILDEWDAGASLAYRVALMEIGATVGDASGAQLTIRYAVHHGNDHWLPSPATSPAEHRALAAAAAALGLAVPAGPASETPAAG
ncbi:MAG: hypothetical protein U0446_06175 [Dehalococcoidia bacterium]